MKLNYEEKQALTNQLKEWRIQMDVLAAKQEAAALAANKFSRELAGLQAKHRAATQQLREQELDTAGFNIWENIGEGG